MRIIGGTKAGLRLNPPKNLPVRPTTDIAKEALFNILNNKVDFHELTCLDLFAGTGNISFELASRGAVSITAVDIHNNCLRYIKEVSDNFELHQIKTRKADVLKYIKQEKKKYDLIFADPPYDLPTLPQLSHQIFDYQLLNSNGLLIIEHPSNREMFKNQFLIEVRKYGNSSFSIYQFS